MFKDQDNSVKFSDMFLHNLKISVFVTYYNPVPLFVNTILIILRLFLWRKAIFITCNHYSNCAHYCAITDSCDYFLDTGSRRPCKAPDCPGYPANTRRGYGAILLPHSLLFDARGEVRGRVSE